MVRHPVDEHAYAPGLRAGNEPVEVFEGAEELVAVAVFGHVVAKSAIGGR